jgi:hypothetical protein
MVWICIVLTLVTIVAVWIAWYECKQANKFYEDWNRECRRSSAQHQDVSVAWAYMLGIANDIKQKYAQMTAPRPDPVESGPPCPQAPPGSQLRSPSMPQGYSRQ